MQFFNNKNDIYSFQGPIGKGLDLHREGVHIAFAAGTGVLPFVDLVAHLIRKNMGLLTKEEDSQLHRSRFKFILHVSFQRRNNGIALELCHKLEDICKLKNKKNFEFHARFSTSIKKKWADHFIKDSLTPHS